MNTEKQSCDIIYDSHYTCESYLEVVTLNPNAFVTVLLTVSSDQKTQKHRLDQLKQSESKERKQLNARAARIVRPHASSLQFSVQQEILCNSASREKTDFNQKLLQVTG